MFLHLIVKNQIVTIFDLVNSKLSFDFNHLSGNMYRFYEVKAAKAIMESGTFDLEKLISKSKGFYDDFEIQKLFL